jgi:hypothetical protein
MVMLEALSPMSMENATGRRAYHEDRRSEWWMMLAVLTTKLEVFLMRKVGMPWWAIVASSGDGVGAVRGGGGIFVVAGG